MFSLKKIFAVVLCFTLLLSFAACGKNDKETDGGSSVNAPTSSNVSTGESSDTDGTSSENQDSSIVESGSEATGSTEDQSGNATTNSNSSKPSSVTTTTTPDGDEIFGQGSKDDPYLEIPTGNENTVTVTTVSIPAGKSLYYGISRVGGKILTIESSNAYVIYDGDRYNAKNGKVTFTVGDALASDYVSFQIGNSGSKAASFVIKFTDVSGSLEKPETISKMNGTTVTTKLAKGNSQGYHYKYITEKAGTLRFYVTNSGTDYMFSATRNMPFEDMIIPVLKNFEDDVLSDSNGKYIEFKVEKGEEIVISIGAKPVNGEYPAVTVKWYGKFVG